MRLKNDVSLAAIFVAAFGLWPAAAQEVMIEGTAKAISAVTLLPGTEAGRAALEANLTTTYAIQNSATTARQAQAMFDNNGSPVNGIVYTGGLSPALDAAFAVGNPEFKVNGVQTATVAVASWGQFYGALNTLSARNADQARNMIGQGFATGTTWKGAGTSSNALGSRYLATLALPEGGILNPLDAYNMPIRPNARGISTRPFGTRPDQIVEFTALDFYGQPLSNMQVINDGINSLSYPSGHASGGWNGGMILAMMVPERWQEELTRASEYADSRIVLGVHFALDAIAGRVLSNYLLVQVLNNNPDFSGFNLREQRGFALPLGENIADYNVLFNQAYTDLRASLVDACGMSIAACIASSAPDRFSDKAKNKADYTYRLTYGLPAVGPTDLAPVVPVGAEVLLQTRFPYLTAGQRREVLATTEIASGAALDDGSGYARLNLYAAGDGYGAFDGAVKVDMDAAKGGFSAFDSWNNDISGAGSLEKIGTGTLNLTGVNSYRGGTTVTGGILSGTSKSFGTGAIVDNAVLVVNQSFEDGTLANAISGGGTLLKMGERSLSLTGDSTLSGKTGVMEGRLAVNGFLGRSIVTVGGGATLGGNGTVGGILAEAGATVAPGNSIGTLDVAGTVVLDAGSTYAVEVNAAGQSDRIAATGAARIEGGRLTIAGEAGTYDPRTRYTILTADGGVSGQFGSVVSGLASTASSVRVSGGRLDLTLTRTDIPFSIIAETGNQAAVADAIQADGPGSFGYDATIGLSTGEARDAFQALAGDIHASTASAELSESRFIREAAMRRVRDAFKATDAAGTIVAQAEGAAASAFWLQGFGSWGEIDGNGGAGGLDTSTGGVLVGVDAPVGGNWRLGALAGYGGSSYDASAASARSDNYHLGVYGGGEWSGFGLRSGLAYTWHDIETSRSVAFPTFSDQLSADYGTSVFQAFGEVGYEIELGRATIEPFANLAYVGLASGAIDESGGSAALHGAGDDVDLGYGTVGVRAASAFTLGEADLAANGGIGWRHALGDETPTTRLSFDGGDAFTTAGSDIGGDAVVIDAGLTARVGKNVSLGVAYTGSFGTEASENGARADLTWTF